MNFTRLFVGYELKNHNEQFTMRSKAKALQTGNEYDKFENVNIMGSQITTQTYYQLISFSQTLSLPNNITSSKTKVLKLVQNYKYVLRGRVQKKEN